MTASTKQTEKATEIIAHYTLLASATGAVPVPASSVAIVAENGIMLAHVADALGIESITISTVVSSMGVAGSLNLLGRTVFIEGAKLLSWGTGSFWTATLLMALGASTAGVQTYIIGRLAVEIGKNHGKALKGHKGRNVIADAKTNYDAFVSYWKSKKIAEPV